MQQIEFDGEADIDCEHSNTIQPTKCRAALAAVDLDRNDLLNKEEYAQFMKRLNDIRFQKDSFDDLPAYVQDVFHKFAEEDTI